MRVMLDSALKTDPESEKMRAYHQMMVCRLVWLVMFEETGIDAMVIGIVEKLVLSPAS